MLVGHACRGFRCRPAFGGRTSHLGQRRAAVSSPLLDLGDLMTWNRWTVALVAVLGVGLYLWRTGPPVWDFVSSVAGDFGYYYEGSARLAEGQSPFQGGFVSPPLMPLVVLPLVPLGLENARIAWYVASQVALLVAAVGLAWAAGRDRAAFASVAILWGTSGGLAENLAIGQVNPVLLLLISVALIGVAGRSRWSPQLMGLAAGLKLWPGLLLGLWLFRRWWRGLVAGLVTTGALIAVPLVVYEYGVGIPASSAGTRFWAGTPAMLSFSLPSAVLRSTYDLAEDGAPPEDWIRGTYPAALQLSPGRTILSLASSLLTLALGTSALWWRLASARATSRADDQLAVAYLATLAVIASPISWYHYQIFLLPAGVLLLAGFLRRTAWWPGAAVTASLLLASWANRGTDLANAVGISTTEYLVAAGIAVPMLNMVVLSFTLREIGRCESTSPKGAVSDPNPSPASGAGS